MTRLRIHGGRIIDPGDGVDTIADLYIADGHIAAIGKPPTGFSADQEIDASGLVVCPGLVDLAAHLREPGQEYKASIASEVRAAAAGGITALCASPDTIPVTDTTAVVELVTRRARQARLSRIMPLGALTLGLEGQQISEMAALREAGCVAVSDGGRPVVNTLVLRRALDYAATQDLLVMLTPADPYLSDGFWMHEGWVSTRLGIAGIPVAAETAGLARCLALVEETGARVHFGRLSSAQGAAMVARARAEGLPVSADVAMHQLFLSEMDVSGFNSLCHVRPPLRAHADREALRAGLTNGAIQAICSDHQPHEPDAKAVTFVASEPGISGLDTLLPLTLRLVDEGLLTLHQALGLVTAGPAAVLGQSSGRIAADMPADLCLFDPEHPWQLNDDTQHSRGRNSPFIGWEFTGQVRMTLLGGRVIYAASGLA
ncbi:MAG: dihydroorotase [Aquisalimonadaceae bacterium]